MRVDAVDAVRGLGGRARWAELRAGVSRRALDRAVAQEQLLRVAGVYSLPDCDRALVAARQLRGVVSHRSAAEHHGFAVPPRLDGEPVSHAVALRPKARRTNLPREVRPYYCALTEDDINGRVLTKVATVAFCLRDLSLREALSVGDSAVRQGVRWTTSGHASASCAAGARQRRGHGSGCWTGIVIECDGFETHGSLEAMTSDCTRHTNLTAAGWRTLRFTWYQVNFCPEWVLGRVLDTLRWAE